MYQNELDKAGFQHDMAYGDFPDLTRRTRSDKLLCDKAFNIDKNSFFYINFFIKKTSATDYFKQRVS